MITKFKKTVVCGLLSIVAIANVFVAVGNEKHKSLYVTKEANSFGIVTGYLIAELLNNAGEKAYISHDRDNLPCSPFEIYRGIVQKGTSLENNLDAKLGITGQTGSAGGTISGSANVGYTAQKSIAGSNSYEYSICIYLPGNDWESVTCQRVSKDQQGAKPECYNFDECAQTIANRAGYYRSAFGLN